MMQNQALAANLITISAITKEIGVKGHNISWEQKRDLRASYTKATMPRERSKVMEFSISERTNSTKENSMKTKGMAMERVPRRPPVKPTLANTRVVNERARETCVVQMAAS